MAKRMTSSTKTQKDKLELEKLELEVSQLRRPTRSALWCITWKDIATVLVAGLGLFLVYWNGLFDVKQERLQAGNERLRIEKIQLEQGNKELESTRNIIQQENEQLEKELQITKNKLGDHEKELAATWKLIKGYKDDGIRIEVTLASNEDSFSYRIKLSPSSWQEHSRFGVEDPPIEVIPQISEVLKTIQDIPRLSDLVIKGIELSKNDIECIAKNKITKLSLIESRLTDDVVEPLGNMRQLTFLGLGGNKGIKHPKFLQQLTSLEILNLSHTSFDDEGMAYLRPLNKTLRYLWMYSTSISDNGLQHLKGFRKIQWLSLDGCHKVKGNGIVDVIVSMPSLESFSVNSCGMNEKEHKALMASLKKNRPSLFTNDHSTITKLKHPAKNKYEIPPKAPAPPVKIKAKKQAPPKVKAETK